MRGAAAIHCQCGVHVHVPAEQTPCDSGGGGGIMERPATELTGWDCACMYGTVH